MQLKGARIFVSAEQLKYGEPLGMPAVFKMKNRFQKWCFDATNDFFNFFWCSWESGVKLLGTQTTHEAHLECGSTALAVFGV